MIEEPVILVVDELERTSDIQFILTMTIPGCRVLTATSGVEALEITVQKGPDLVIFDVTANEVDGFAFLKKLKLKEELEDIPVIFLSGIENTQNIVIGLNLGAVDFVRKPYYPKEVVARVKFQLKLRAQQILIKAQNLQNKELLQVLCHDLVNQNIQISGLLTLQKMNPGKTEEYLEMIGQSAENIAEMIQLVTKFRSVEDGKLQIQLAPLDVSYAISTSLQILETRLEEKQISVNVDIEDNLTILTERTSFINSVICNLITNAMKFSFPESEIHIMGKSLRDGMAMISVHDHGIGMPPKILENLFKMNKATNRSGTRKESGTGYGMPLVRKFVSIYGGDISVQSTEKGADPCQHGTTVTLLLKVPAS